MKKHTFAIVTALAALAIDAAPSRLENKIIAYGWDTIFAQPEDILENAAAFDKGPCDGVGLMLEDKSVFLGDVVWTKENSVRWVELLKKFPEHKGLKDSFVSIYFQPRSKGSLKDDAFWRHAGDNLGTAAWIVKSAGLPGLFFDTEDYRHCRQFVYGKRDEQDGLTYDDACALARQRGREVFGPMFREYPEIVTIAFYWFVCNPYYERYFGQLDPAGKARMDGDLWYPFLNGMLDVAPETAQVFDGNEDAYYHEAARKAFQSTYTALNRLLQNVVEPENRAKYKRIIRQSHGLYLDMYTNKKGAQYYWGPLTSISTRTDRFAENVDGAVKGADGYIWLYGEKLGFIDWKLSRKPRHPVCTFTNVTWEVGLPGFSQAVRYARDPYTEIMKSLEDVKSERVTAISNDQYKAVLENGATHDLTVNNLRAGGYYAFIGEIRGNKTECNTVPAANGSVNWKYTWHYPFYVGKTEDGWRRFVNYMHLPPDCTGIWIHQEHRRGSDKAEYRHFKVVELQ